VAPLLLFAAVVLLLMSSVVIVHNDQSAVILRLGRIDHQREPLGPGIHLKWPWPIDTTRFFNTGDVKKLVLGVHEGEQESYLRDIYRPGTNVKRVLLWQEAHEGERSYLMAQPPRDGQQGAATVALGNLVFVVNYRIDDVYTYGFKYHDTDRLLADIAQAELTNFAATTTLLESAEELGDVDPDHPRSIMTVGRERAADVLKDRLNKALARRGGLGVKITYVGLATVHPPSGAAEAYEDVVKAQLSILTKEYQAEGAAAEALAEVAGDPLIARLLAQSIDTRQKISELESYLRADPPDLDELAKALDSYIHQASQRVEMYNTRIEREKLLGRLTNRRIEEVSSQVRAGQVTLRDLAHRDVNDVLVMLLAHRRQLRLLEQIESRRAGGEQIALAQTLERTNRRINSLFEEAYGEPAKLIAEAREQRRGLELAERTSAESFQRRLAAWRASPNMYELDRRLDVLERVLPEIETKFVVGVDPNRLQLWHDRTGQAEALAEIPWGQQPGASE
jgi:regulator of protease activity HflC (stomatin/prohibitin superfamily)